MLPRTGLRIAVWLSLSLLPVEAGARCTQASDLQELGSAVAEDLACRLQALVGSGGPCPAPDVPPCAAGTAERVAEAILGTDPGPVAGWTPDALRCQQDLVLGGGRFVDKRLAERAAGHRRSKSARVLRRAAKSCGRARVETNSGGEPLVRVGPACAPILGAVGSDIDGDRLSRCVRATLEAAVDDVAPSPLSPNILLILTDDQRHDTLDVMPATSTLGDEGVFFPNAFVTNPVCTPSRASILTGRYSRNNGVLSNAHFAELDDTDAIAPWLEAVGYTNALIGKYVNNSELLGLTPPAGWHEWKSFLEASGGDFFGFRVNENGVVREYGSNRYSTDWVRDEAVRFVNREKERPFFLVVSPFAPHGPATPARRHEDSLAGLPPHRPPSWLDDVSTKPAWVKFYKAIASDDIADQIDAFRLAQLRTLLAVDEAVDRILARLEKVGLADNTVIVFTSDHGYSWGEHWLRNKFSPYEESIRVPYVLRYPRRWPAPEVREEMVLNLDLAPTFADLAGVPVPPDLDGQSLVPLVESPGAPWRDEFLIETTGEFITKPSESVRTPDWKYVDTMASTGVTQELYDLDADPFEQVNLAADPDHADVLAEMMARLDGLRGS